MDFKERDRWMRNVLADHQIPMAQRAVLVRMALFLRVATGELPFKWDCLAQALGGAPDSTIDRAMKAGEARGWLLVHRSGRGQQNKYSLRLAPCDSHHASHDSRDASRPDSRSASLKINEEKGNDPLRDS